MTVRVVSLRRLPDGMRERWDELTAASVQPNPFYEPEPVLAAAELLEQGQDAALLVVEQDGALLMVLPVLRRRRFRRVPVPALNGWQHPYCYSGVPLVRRGAEDRAWSALLAHGRSPAAEPWLVLERVPLEGPVVAALRRLPGCPRLSELDPYGRPVLHRRQQATYLEGRLSARHLKTLRRQRRRLADELGGPVEVVDRCAGPDVPGAVEELLRMEAAGWKGRAGTAMACRPGDAAWFRRVCAAMHEQGRLQLWALQGGGRVAAWQVNLLAGDTVFHFKIAYDEELARSSPGLQLELEMVEEFHRDTRLDRVDSCVDADNKVSAQLYPDRERVAILALPLRSPAGPVAVASAVALTAARRRALDVRRARDGQEQT